MSATVVRGVCPLDCPDTCSMLVQVENKRVVGVKGDREHPFTRGFLCQKMARYLERVYHPDRLLHPLKRVGPKGEGRFERISWDEALSQIAARFLRGSQPRPTARQAILPYSYYGTMGKLQAAQPRPSLLPSPGRLEARPHDLRLGRQARATSTPSAGAVLAPTRWPSPDCRFIVNWGSNTANTNSHLWSLMIEARKQRRDDRHRRPLPRAPPPHDPTGTSSPDPEPTPRSRLGLMHVIWRDGLADDDYLARATLGAEPLRDRVLTDYPPERVAAITGVDVDDDRDRSRNALATEQPSLIRLNYGMQRHHGGGMAVRTIACLPAIVGSWRYPGGGALLTTSGAYDFAMDRLTRPDLSPPGTRTINMNQLGEALAGELARAARPARSTSTTEPGRRHAQSGPGGSRACCATTSSPSSTSCSRPTPSTTPTSSCPPPSQLEHVDLHGSYGHLDVMYNTPAVAPPGECRSNNDVFRALAGQLGFEPELFPDDETLIREALDGGPTLQGITLESPAGRRLRSGSTSPTAIAPSPTAVFPTDSGICELYSERMQADGFDPLPSYTPPREDPQTAPDLAERYPLQLLSPPRPQFLNSTFAESDRHRQAAGEPTIELSDADARERGLSDGQMGRSVQRSRPFPRPGRPQGHRQTRSRRRPGPLLVQTQPRRRQRQPHHLLRPHRHGRRRHVF